MKAHDSRSAGAGIGAALLGGTALGAYLLPALAGLSGRDGAPRLPRLRAMLGVEDRTSSGEGFALTFDDGPHPQGTPAMLEILRDAGIGATFFLVGEQARRTPSLVAEILAAGHGIGLHCDRHRNLARLTPAAVREDIQRALDSLGELSGGEIGLYRPPYGVLNAAALRIARAHGWRTLLWTRWGRDWEARATPAAIAARVSARAHAGDVLLLHDADEYSAEGSWRRTALALPRVLDSLADQGLAPAPI